MSVLTETPVRERVIDIGATLGWYRHGGGDPTTWIRSSGRGPTSSGEFIRATHTPDGPGTLYVRWGLEPADDVPGVPDVSVRTWGPGGPWLAARVPSMLGVDDPGAEHLRSAPHEVVATAAHRHRALRHGASGNLYHELLPTIIEQRITIGEAHRQWQLLCRGLGEPAPGPFARLLLPPAPAMLARQPSWWFHPLGIERRRAEPLIELGRHPVKLWEWAARPPAEVATLLRHLPGIGVWTVGTALGPALGDPDALAVGDYHLKNTIGWALAGEARATDERMLELLAPYAGDRGRVARLIKLDGHGAPKFGPKQRILPMREW